MGKTLTFEQMMALFAEGRKETAELRKSMAEETAKLRKNMADGFAESRKETAKLSASIARLEDITEKTNARVDATNARLDATIVEMRENTAQMKINNHNMGLQKIYGALATAIAKKKPVNYALGKGFYVLQQPDVMGVKILDFPKGHSAKAY
jgi:uncharacterized HAD superfamily protein